MTHPFNPHTHICVEGASTHNLKHATVAIPKHQLTVITGVSGSGKSSLAFHTICAEAQRRFMNTLSDYARQFMGQLPPPPVERLQGLSPAIAIEQKTTSYSPRSTVGTVTEVMDYLRVLYAKAGTPHCPSCGAVITPQRPAQIVERLGQWPEQTRVQLLAPLVRGRKGEYGALFHQLRKEGFNHVRVDGRLLELDELPDNYTLERYKIHTIEVVVDRFFLKATDAILHRLEEGVSKALKKSGGYITVLRQTPQAAKQRVSAPSDWEELAFSQHLACLPCDLDFGELAPRSFSFNSPYGACPTCHGTGQVYDVNLPAFIKDPDAPVEKAIAGFKWLLWGRFTELLPLLESAYGVDLAKPWKKLPDWQQQLWLYGTQPNDDVLTACKTQKAQRERTQAQEHPWVQGFSGLVKALLDEVNKPTASQVGLEYWQQFIHQTTCPDCQGDRLKPFALKVQLQAHPHAHACTTAPLWNIPFQEMLHMSIDDALPRLSEAWQHLDTATLTVAQAPLHQVLERLSFLRNVGLGYLTLGRSAATLSGGEAQRIRLASQLGSGLSGVLVVLDEPSIGLHPYNNDQLIETLQALRDKGNTVLVVEHDEDMIRAADHVVEIGPLAGTHGGEVLFSGTVDALMQQPTGHSPTADFLSQRRRLPVQHTPRQGNGQHLTLKGVHKHNLKHVDFTLPLGQLVAITGLSGSGKSTLMSECLEPLLRQWLQISIGGYGRRKKDVTPKVLPLPPEIQAVEGLEAIERMIVVDQSPIGKSSRSNPATYTGLFDSIRAIFSSTLEAKKRGLAPGAFSFNVKGGRCEACQGTGEQVVSLGMLPDTSMPCDVCHGQRYKPEVLAVQYRGVSIAEVLAMPIEAACTVFEDHAGLHEKLQLLCEVGLGYLRLGQSSATLSGGEAQRLKLATELMRKSNTPTVYLLDEPSVGLHWHDLELLLTLFNKLVDAGHTVVFIEHNLDLIAACDTLIDLGPYGGQAGGQIVATGSVAELAQHPASLTGRYLQRYL